MTKKLTKLPAGLPIEDSVIKNDDPRTTSIEEVMDAMAQPAENEAVNCTIGTTEEARAQVWAKEAQLAAQEAVYAAMADGVGFTKVTFSDEEGIKVEHMSYSEFLAEPASSAYTHGLTGMGCGDRVIIDDPHNGPLTGASYVAAAARVEGMLHPEDSYGSAVAMARGLELLNLKYVAQTPDWAINTPDPHAPWPDPRPEPASDAHGMDFGDAIRCLKRGQRVQRAGWQDAYVFLRKGVVSAQKWGFKVGQFIPAEHLSTQDGIPLGLFNAGEKDTATEMPCLFMWSGGARVPGWQANQTDMFATDWRVVG